MLVAPLACGATWSSASTVNAMVVSSCSPLVRCRITSGIDSLSAPSVPAVTVGGRSASRRTAS